MYIFLILYVRTYAWAYTSNNIYKIQGDHHGDYSPVEDVEHISSKTKLPFSVFESWKPACDMTGCSGGVATFSRSVQT